MKSLIADLRLALVALLSLVLLSFTCCQPIRFFGPSPSPRWGFVVCGAAGAFVVLGLLQIRPALREKAREREEERQRQRLRAEAAHHVG